METDEMSVDQRLAAIILLLSSSALRGATGNKTAALQAHLEAAVCVADHLGAPLRDALGQVSTSWQKIHCHPASVPVDFCPTSLSGQALH